MDADQYQAQALSKEADQKAIFDWVVSQGTFAVRVNNAMRGLGDEYGELCTLFKRWLEYQEPLPADINVKVGEEIGDALWRLSQLAAAFGLTLNECMQANLAKLFLVRYKNGACNPEEALNRDLNAEQAELANSLQDKRNAKNCS